MMTESYAQLALPANADYITLKSSIDAIYTRLMQNRQINGEGISDGHMGWKLYREE
jgi:hypothetical protein